MGIATVVSSVHVFAMKDTTSQYVAFMISCCVTRVHAAHKEKYFPGFQRIYHLRTFHNNERLLVQL